MVNTTRLARRADFILRDGGANLKFRKLIHTVINHLGIDAASRMGVNHRRNGDHRPEVRRARAARASPFFTTHADRRPLSGGFPDRQDGDRNAIGRRVAVSQRESVLGMLDWQFTERIGDTHCRPFAPSSVPLILLFVNLSPSQWNGRPIPARLSTRCGGLGGNGLDRLEAAERCWQHQEFCKSTGRTASTRRPHLGLTSRQARRARFPLEVRALAIAVFGAPRPVPSACAPR